MSDLVNETEAIKIEDQVRVLDSIRFGTKLASNVQIGIIKMDNGFETKWYIGIPIHNPGQEISQYDDEQFIAKFGVPFSIPGDFLRPLPR